MNDPSTSSLFPGLEAPATIAAGVTAPTSTPDVAKAMALLWTYRPRTAIYALLPLLGLKRSDGRAFTQEEVKRPRRASRVWMVERAARARRVFSLAGRNSRPLVPRVARCNAGRNAARCAAQA